MKSKLWNLYFIDGAYWIPFKKMGKKILIYYILMDRNKIKIEKDLDEDWLESDIVKDSKERRVIIEKLFKSEIVEGR